jgi:hypothetical protein
MRILEGESMKHIYIFLFLFTASAASLAEVRACYTPDNAHIFDLNQDAKISLWGVDNLVNKPAWFQAQTPNQALALSLYYQILTDASKNKLAVRLILRDDGYIYNITKPIPLTQCQRGLY